MLKSALIFCWFFYLSLPLDSIFASYEKQPSPEQLIHILNQQYQQSDIAQARKHQKLLEKQKFLIEHLNHIQNDVKVLKKNFRSGQKDLRIQIRNVEKSILELKAKQRFYQEEKSLQRTSSRSTCFLNCSMGRPKKKVTPEIFTQKDRDALVNFKRLRKSLNRKLCRKRDQFEEHHEEYCLQERETQYDLSQNRQKISELINESLNIKTRLLSWMQKILNSKVSDLKTESDHQKENQRKSRELVKKINQDYLDKFNEMSHYTGLSDQREVDLLCDKHPNGALFFYTMLNHLSTNLQIYLSLSTDKIAFATDKTAQTAQMIGKAVDLVPVISGVGGVAEAIVVFENGRRKQKRAKNVFRTLGNAFRMHQIARKICLKMSQESLESLAPLSQKEIQSRAFKTAKIVQRIISGNSVKFFNTLSPEELADTIYARYEQSQA